jgi:hypothetical protein
VTTEGLIQLHNFIERDYCASDKQGRQRAQRRIQKLASTALISIANQSLLRDHNRILLQVNKESLIQKVKSTVLAKGEGKVIRYEISKQNKQGGLLRTRLQQEKARVNAAASGKLP